MRLSVSLCFILYLASPFPSMAQISPGVTNETRDKEAILSTIEVQKDYTPAAKRALDNNNWAQLTKDPAFRYEQPASPTTNPSASAWQRFWGKLFHFFASSNGKILIWAGVALLLVLLIVYILKQNGQLFFSKKDKHIATHTHTNDDEHIPEDWNRYIQDMADAGQYRMALRYGYRYLLELFGTKELLQLQPAKTNYQYLYELANSEWYAPFRQLTQQYEYAWYGGFEVNDQQFNTFYTRLMEVKQKLGLD